MSSTASPSKARQSGVTIRPVREQDLPVADRIMRLAFGTFIGMPDPLKFMGDADFAGRAGSRIRPLLSPPSWRGNS